MAHRKLLEMVTGTVSLSLAQPPNCGQTIPNHRGRSTHVLALQHPRTPFLLLQKKRSPSWHYGGISLLHWADACIYGRRVRSGLQVALSKARHPGSCQRPASFPASGKGKHCPFHLRFLAEAVKLLTWKHLNHGCSHFPYSVWRNEGTQVHGCRLHGGPHAQPQRCASILRPDTAWSSHFVQLPFSPAPFLLERTADTGGYSHVGVRQIFPQKWTKPLTSTKTAPLSFVANGKIWAFKKRNQNFGKLVSASGFRTLNDFLNETNGDIKKCDLMEGVKL